MCGEVRSHLVSGDGTSPPFYMGCRLSFEPPAVVTKITQEYQLCNIQRDAPKEEEQCPYVVGSKPQENDRGQRARMVRESNTIRRKEGESCIRSGGFWRRARSVIVAKDGLRTSEGERKHTVEAEQQQK
jgi:hypothetical protein